MNGISKNSRFGLLCVVFTLATFLSCSEKETPAELPQDVTPPAAVTDLTCFNPETSSIALRWIAPGDDGNNGTASQYDFRYSTSLINDANWPSAPQVAGEPLPKAAGNAGTLI